MGNRVDTLSYYTLMEKKMAVLKVVYWDVLQAVWKVVDWVVMLGWLVDLMVVE